ncbi:MAG TPA: hypothetical protein PKY12_12895, partial [Catalimonadaceae bacterium]|nr:hypothetical protein [Catalimonadaceae bacterium]
MKKISLLLFTCCIGLPAFADTLRNQTFTKPLVLKGNKAWVVENCRFEGTGAEVGLTLMGAAKVYRCSFTNLKTGLIFKGRKKAFQELSISQNRFTNCHTGVYLKEGVIDLDFRCNQFKLSCMEDYPSNGPAVTNSSHPCYSEFTNGPGRVGLFVGENVALQNIGGPGGSLSPIVPAGNVWPVGNKSQAEIELSSYELTGWVHPPNFTAVVNESEEQWRYYFFDNEFFNYINNSTSLFPVEPTGRYARTSTDQEIPPALAGQVDLVCEDVFTSVVFPLLPRPSLGNNMTATLNQLKIEEAILGQNVPNPAMNT